MSCCATCFGDSFLRTQIEERFSTGAGDCSYCGSTNVLLAEPLSFRDLFELLQGVYRRGPGKKLATWLRDDWSLLARLDVLQADMLLAAILEDAQIGRKRYVPSTPDDGSSLQRWQDFRNELKHENRFFPKRVPDLDRLRSLLESYLCAEPGCIPDSLYRARICDGDQLYAAAEMGRPPSLLAANGRANPVGIPYFYLASDVDTAIAEVRPHAGDKVCVAEFAVARELKIADLRDPRKTISPFSLSDEDGISSLRRDVSFLCQLGEELARPVLPKAADLEYLPSQYLCELIKDQGFDGVMYGSSVGTGVNVALFGLDPDLVGDIQQFVITRVNVDKERCRTVGQGRQGEP